MIFGWEDDTRGEGGKQGEIQAWSRLTLMERDHRVLSFPLSATQMAGTRGMRSGMADRGQARFSKRGGLGVLALDRDGRTRATMEGTRMSGWQSLRFPLKRMTALFIR
jgi:hypothetical protein